MINNFQQSDLIAYQHNENHSIYYYKFGSDSIAKLCVEETKTTMTFL